MAITPKKGFIVDPNNPNGVIRDPGTSPTLLTGGAESGADLSKAGTPGFDVFGNKVDTSAPNVFESVAASEQALQDEANAIKDSQNTGTSGFVSSSASVVQDEKNTTKDVGSLLSSLGDDGTTNATAASTEYIRLLDEQTTALEKRRTEEIAQINANFEGAKTSLKDTQTRESGTTAVGLARAGGFLGISGSGTGVMLTLAQNHKQELGSLEGRRASAIQEANNAITDKQFALAQLKVQEVKDIENTIHERKRQFFSDTIDATREARNEDEFYRTKIKDDLATLGELGAADGELELDPARAAAIDEFYGVPGFTQQYLETINQAAKVSSAASALEAQENLVDLLQKLPAGQEVTFPDGTTYTGMGTAGDIYTTMETDDAGVSRMVAYNKRTGAIDVTNLGAIGGSKGGGGDDDALFEDNVTSSLQIQLEAEKMEDGSYDPETYIRERVLIKEADPTLVSKMDAKFLNPSNGFFTIEAIEQLRKKGVFAPTPGL